MKVTLLCLFLVVLANIVLSAETSENLESAISRPKRSPFFFGGLRNFFRRQRERRNRYVNNQIGDRQRRLNDIYSRSPDRRRGLFGALNRLGRNSAINTLNTEIRSFRECGSSCCGTRCTSYTTPRSFT
ncbi:uncharacterized protein LOC131890774, partial [Tigriopus californicus]|uniref:uncharacterized protein LOC131890774 n=1 Tax=Tigriopus californicus TaxID=6832 RepID=UPI0027D9D904